MTTISLALSAIAPGQWTGRATTYDYLDTVGPADIYGNPAGDPASQTRVAVSSGAVALPNEAADGTYEQQVLDDLQFGGTHLQASAGLVTVTSYTNEYGLDTGDAPGYLQTITADGPWNLIKDIAVTALSSQAVTISNFVDVDLDTGNDRSAHVIDVEDAKRGDIVAAGSKENVNIGFLSNEYSWSNTFDVTLGDGNNTLSVAPVSFYAASQIAPLTPMTFNTAPQNTIIDLTTGNGTNTLDLRESSDKVHLGRGTNTLRMIDGNNEVWTSGGNDIISIFSHTLGELDMATDTGSDLIHLGSFAASVFVDDSVPATMGQTTVEVTAPPNFTDNQDAAIIYGHYAAGLAQVGQFTGGDWSHVTIDFKGFAAGSEVTFVSQPQSDVERLVAQDARTGITRTVLLEGAATSLDQLHVVKT